MSSSWTSGHTIHRAMGTGYLVFDDGYRLYLLFGGEDDPIHTYDRSVALAEVESDIRADMEVRFSRARRLRQIVEGVP